MSFTLVGFLREEKKFASLEELIAQIKNDVNVATLFCEQSKFSSYYQESQIFLLDESKQDEIIWLQPSLK